MPQMRRRVERATRARERHAPKALPKVQTESKSREARVISDRGRSGQKASARCSGERASGEKGERDGEGLLARRARAQGGSRDAPALFRARTTQDSGAASCELAGSPEIEILKLENRNP